MATNDDENWRPTLGAAPGAFWVPGLGFVLGLAGLLVGELWLDETWPWIVGLIVGNLIGGLLLLLRRRRERGQAPPSEPGEVP
ncbi:hypothetical protein Bcav_3461 [Beutenbergia cavernae DSM 12333]|uniref:Uncharacterized protein n=1 Tax=Beutenbergia cavernae (strain ATCC BAA-8 / DSM 12333 / CCUG 43141 / JCM 11478 / NBRC 16432 / NCIMB 13614 / HKI 0122) TaxID=471853 RepID=C5C278_BEUC1|nr:hypothetical protein [Beutenbergia cavernae]ACQ81703.1 hypothetical protein Bcav_3461 [Beutenbergia cavernae DSM 12333]